MKQYKNPGTSRRGARIGRQLEEIEYIQSIYDHGGFQADMLTGKVNILSKEGKVTRTYTYENMKTAEPIGDFDYQRESIESTRKFSRLLTANGIDYGKN